MSTVTILSPIYYNSINLLSVTGLRILGYTTYRPADKTIESLPVAYYDKSTTVLSNLKHRIITINCDITRQSQELLEESLDNLYYIFNEINKTLIVPMTSESREYRNTSLNNINIVNKKGGFAQILIEIIAANPFSYATTSVQVLSNQNENSGDQSYPVYFEGSALQMPTITYTLDSVEYYATAARVGFINPATNMGVYVTRVWAAGDVLVIDNEANTVTVNGDYVDYTGQFVGWYKGNGYLNYLDTFIGRQADMIVSYYKKYR